MITFQGKVDFESELVTLEIGSLGHCWRVNLATSLARHLNLTKAIIRSILDDAAKNAIASSHQIFLARQEKHWTKPSLL